MDRETYLIKSIKMNYSWNLPYKFLQFDLLTVFLNFPSSNILFSPRETVKTIRLFELCMIDAIEMQVGINRQGRQEHRLKSTSNYKYNARVRGVTISVAILRDRIDRYYTVITYNTVANHSPHLHFCSITRIVFSFCENYYS